MESRNDTDECMYRAKVDSQTWRANLRFPEGDGEGGTGWELGIDSRRVDGWWGFPV